MLSALLSILAETFPGNKYHWHQSTDLPDQTGRVHLVTGGNSGIGFEAAKCLLRANAIVYIAARSADKARKEIADLKGETGREAHFLQLDLASLASVRRAASVFLSKESELHVLYNNAGVMFTDFKLLTEDGYDLQWGTNVLGHFYFTQLLLPALKRATGGSRVVNLTSWAQHMTGELRFETCKPGPARDAIAGGKYELYASSKLGNAVFAKEFDRRYRGDNIVSTLVDPGTIKTDLFKHSKVWELLTRPIMFDRSYGALNMLYAGTSEEAKDHGGKYIAPWATIRSPNPQVNDAALGLRFWEWCETEIKNFEATQ